MTNLERMLTLVRDEHIDFATFVSKTRTEFERMARHLLRRWAAPEWFTLEDLEQELYLGAWKYIPRYNASHGVTFSRYIVFNAMASAKAYLHKARGVTLSGVGAAHPDRKTSHIETPLTFFGENGEGESLMNAIMSESPRAEDALIANEERRAAVQMALGACATRKERYAVLAIREAGGLDGAADVLYEDIDHRIDLRLHSEAHADRFVLRNARAVARRLAEATVND